MKKFRNQKGFTLIEVLIVVIIVAILATLGIARFLQTRADSEEATCDSNIATLNAGVQACILQHPGVPLASSAIDGGSGLPDAIQADDVIATIGSDVECPSGGTYTLDSVTQQFTCDATGHNGIE